MRAAVAEGQERLEEKRRKRSRKEAESAKRLEAGQRVLDQMAVQIAQMKERQATDQLTRAEVLRTAETQLDESVAQVAYPPTDT
eukprot:4546813-Pyramimonas_sp.AAC.1